MGTLYYIKVGKVEVEMGAAGCSALNISRRTGAVSTASWEQAVAFDTAPQWPYGTYVTLQRRTDGGEPEILFQGMVTLADSTGSGLDESIRYTASDAWWHFEREIYRHTRSIVDNTGNPASILSARVLLCQATDGTRLTAAQTVSALASFAASIGVPIQAGTFDAPITPPWDEVRDRTIAEIILRVLRWQPDAVAWIDHTTVPPTLNVTRRGSMQASALALASLDTCRVRPCPELTVPGVEIYFERSGEAGRTIDIQSAGDPKALGCVRMTIPLEFEAGIPGPVTDLSIVPLGDYTKLEWWQRMFPWLPAGTEINDAAMTPTPSEGFTNVLAGGVIPEWLTDSRGISATRHTVSCTAKMSIDGHSYAGKKLSRSFMLTNATKRRYIGKFTPGWSEPVPLDLAAIFYAAASVLQYAGSISMTEGECSAGRALIGAAVNITGGAAAWASMNAPAVSVDEDFDAGQTVITLGPQEHLGIQDLVELFRAGRVRSSWTPLDPLSPGGPTEEEVENPFAPESSGAESPGKIDSLEITDDED